MKLMGGDCFKAPHELNSKLTTSPSKKKIDYKCFTSSKLKMIKKQNPDD
jgi:hypothetical protein